MKSTAAAADLIRSGKLPAPKFPARVKTKAEAEALIRAAGLTPIGGDYAPGAPAHWGKGAVGTLETWGPGTYNHGMGHIAYDE